MLSKPIRTRKTRCLRLEELEPRLALSLPRPDHVVLVMMENHSYNEIIGVSSAPYINNTLAAQGALMTNSFAIEHPSQPNYLDIFSGSNQGVTDDTVPPPGSPYTTPDLGGELIQAGFTFGGFSEDMPSVGYTGSDFNNYARKHNPMVDFADVPSADNMPYAGFFPTDFTKLPTFSFVVPNVINDMHDGSVSTGDTWLQNNVEAYRQWAMTHNSLLIVTFDEDDGSQHNQIATIFDGQMVKAGQYSEHLDHFGVLRTIEDMYGLPHAGASATATTISDIFVNQSNHLKVAAPSSTTAGSSFSITITAQDANNNTLTSYLGTIHFTSSDTAAVLPSDYTFTAVDAGVHTFTGVILKTAGSQSITATDTVTSSITGNSSVTVNPAAVSTLVVTGYPSPATAGTSHNFTVIADDAFGNTATGYRGTLTFSSSDGQAVLPANYTFVSSDSGKHTFSATLKTTGSQAITATDTVTSSLQGSQTGITVNPAAASKLVVSGYPSTTTAGASHSLTVTAQDANNNTLTSYLGTIHFTSSDSKAVLPSNYTFTAADAGVHTFTGVILKTAGSQSITATDTMTSSIQGSQSGITVSPAAVSGLRVTAPASVTAGGAFTITVSAVDSFNNVISSYLGTVHFTSSDSQAVLPADYTFVGADAGVHAFTTGVKLKTVGSQTITATDTVTSSLTGHAAVTVNSGTLTPALFGRSSSDGQVWGAVTNGASGFTTSSWATMSTGVKWVDVLMGDFNGDGKTDIVARAAQTGDVWVGLSNGSTFQFSRWTTWSTGVTWADVRVGDFNGDGKADLVGRVQQTGQWWMGQSTGSSFSESLWATWSTAASWTDVSVGDFNGNGKDDIAGFSQGNGQWWVALSNGNSFTSNLWAKWSTGATWVDVQVGDFNGDGKADLTARALQNGQWYAALSNGSAFNTSLWATWSTGATWVDVKVGDFNGDGKTDIIGRALQNGQWYVGLSDGSKFNTSLWASWSTGATWVDVQVGDFNRDGKSDIVGRALENGQWYTGLSNGSVFNTTLWAAWSTGVTWVDVRLGKNL
jgi:Phosphoesterase family/FG-GAP-like repeat